jgi:hypothetical protein
LETSNVAAFVSIRDDVTVPRASGCPESRPAVLVDEAGTAAQDGLSELVDQPRQEALHFPPLARDGFIPHDFKVLLGQAAAQQIKSCLGPQSEEVQCRREYLVTGLTVEDGRARHVRCGPPDPKGLARRASVFATAVTPAVQAVPISRRLSTDVY